MTTAKREKYSKGEQERLTKELEQTFPASDPPASTQPGSGVTGPEVAKPKGESEKPPPNARDAST